MSEPNLLQAPFHHRKNPMDIEELRLQYMNISGRGSRLRKTVAEQLSRLLDDADVTLGVPMESRVKAWSSIEEKIKRKSLSIDHITDLPDLVGIRTILLFRTDLETMDKLIHDTFDVLSSEDTAKRLGDAQFGYQSQHYGIALPKSWLTVPSMADLGDLQIEFQVRTLAQHIWAAASHKLQYKQESSVPPPLRRTINRVSALLETVDIEFDRVLSERKNYREKTIPKTSGSEVLNVELVTSILSNLLPPENRSDDEPYESLLDDLMELSVRTVDELNSVLNDHLETALKSDQDHVEDSIEDEDFIGTDIERLERGVYFNHVGLTREALRKHFGNEKVNAILKSRMGKI